MKKLSLLLLLFTSILFSQEKDFNSWVINTNGGFIKVRDITYIKPFNVKVGTEYWLNNKFGAGLTIGRTDLTSNIRFNTFEFGGVANVGRIMNFESFTDMYTILFSLGGTFVNSHDNNIIFNDMNGFHISSKITNVVKITDKLSAILGLGLLSGVNSRPNQPSSTITTVIFDFNGGLTYNIGKRDKNPYWYIDEIISDSIYIDRTITNNLPIVKKYFTNTIYKYINVNEYVFFDLDKDEVTKDGYNVILKTADKMLDNPKLRVNIIGYACNDSSVDYNIHLSERRALSIKKYLLALQIPESRITIESKGIDKDMLDLHNLSRRIKIILK